jgi:GT2 family glycosyltransferase
MNKGLSYLLRRDGISLKAKLKNGKAIYEKRYQTRLSLELLLAQIPGISSDGQIKISQEDLSNLLVIIPIYNSPDLVKKCIDSVIEHQPNVDILAIDDCSTDEAIGILLDDYKSRFSNQFSWKQTSSNLGFPGAVNFGLNFRNGRSVLLVNSDVVVYSNFASKMLEGLRHNQKVASITCLTNAGETASIPTICENTDLTENSSLENVNKALDESIAFQNPTTWPEIPSGVGFCMLMSSKALNEVGVFDEAKFAPGYGEENDWSLRAKKKGFKNLLCPTVYVYHKHGFTYGVAKNQLLVSHLKIIDHDYPFYRSLVSAFISNDPLLYFRQAIFFKALSESSDFESCLIFDHQLGGGAVKTLQYDIESSRNTLSVILTSVEEEKIKLSIHFRNLKPIEFQGNVSSLAILVDFLAIKKILINTVAFVGQTESTLDLILSLQKNPNLETEFRLHDYHAICPSLNLLNSKGTFCDVPDVTICRGCLPNNLNSVEKEVIDIELWRDKWRDVLEHCSTVVAYSVESAERLLRTYPQLRPQIKIKKHNVQKIVAPTPRSKRSPLMSQLRIGVVGNINMAKGSQIVIDLARTIKQSNNESTIFVFGSVAGVPDGLPISGQGPYSYPWDLYTKLKFFDLDVLLVPSIWPETYNLVSDELAEMGLPVVMFDFGAPFERHRSNELFHFVPFQEGIKLFQTIQSVVQEYYSSK